MAIQPPPNLPQQVAPPPATRKSGCLGRGCGFGCGGCLVAVVLALLLVVGGGWWFFVVQASAAVTAPATLIVYNQTVSVNGSPGTAGEALNANDSVKTQTGHAAIQFPDGSYVRMSPNTEVQITKVQLQKAGNLDAVEVAQKAGRTLVNVQHLASGSTFKIDGHSVSAEVRGTQFEVLVRQNNTNLFKVFVGSVSVNGTTKQTVNAGQEVDVSANGVLSAVRPIQRDPQDPYALTAQCAAAVSGGTTQGTLQVSTGDPIATGQTAVTHGDLPVTFVPTLAASDTGTIGADNLNGLNGHDRVIGRSSCLFGDKVRVLATPETEAEDVCRTGLVRRSCSAQRCLVAVSRRLSRGLWSSPVP